MIMSEEIAEYLIKDKDYISYRIGTSTQNGITEYIIWLFDNPNIPKETLRFSKDELLSTKREIKLNELGI